MSGNNIQFNKGLSFEIIYSTVLYILIRTEELGFLKKKTTLNTK
jgi:hypothetical protein